MIISLQHSNSTQVDTLDDTNNRITPLLVTADNGEDDIYSSVSDVSLENPASKCKDDQPDHTYDAAEFNNNPIQTESKDKQQYNTLQHGGTVGTLTHTELSPGLYNTIGKTNASEHGQKPSNKGDLISEEYDNVAGVRYKSMDSKMASDTTRKQGEPMYEMVPLEYEIPTGTLTRNEAPTNYKMFDDDMYDKHQSVFEKKDLEKRVGDSKAEGKDQLHSDEKVDENHLYAEPLVSNLQMQTHTHQPVFEKEDLEKRVGDSKAEGKYQLHSDENVDEDNLYAEPLVSNQVQRQIQSRDASQDDEHLYHSLEENEAKNKDILNQPITPTAVGDTFQQLPASETVKTTPNVCDFSGFTDTYACVKKPEKEKEYYQAHTSLSHSSQSLDEMGATKDPILLNIEPGQFDDSMYDSVSRQLDTVQDKREDNIFDDPTYA